MGNAAVTTAPASQHNTARLLHSKAAYPAPRERHAAVYAPSLRSFDLEVEEGDATATAGRAVVERALDFRDAGVCGDAAPSALVSRPTPAWVVIGSNVTPRPGGRDGDAGMDAEWRSAAAGDEATGDSVCCRRALRLPSREPGDAAFTRRRGSSPCEKGENVGFIAGVPATETETRQL